MDGIRFTFLLQNFLECNCMKHVPQAVAHAHKFQQNSKLFLCLKHFHAGTPVQCRERTIIGLGLPIFLVFGAELASPLILPVNILLDSALFPRNAGQGYAYGRYPCKCFDFRLSDLSKGQRYPSQVNHIMSFFSFQRQKVHCEESWQY